MAHNVQWGGERTIKLFGQKKAYYEQVTQDQWNSKVQSQFIQQLTFKNCCCEVVSLGASIGHWGQVTTIKKKSEYIDCSMWCRDEAIRKGNIAFLQSVLKASRAFVNWIYYNHII